MLDTLSVSNRILARLPRKEYQRLLPALELVSLKFGQVLYRKGDPIRHVYFPNDCMFSLLTPIGDRQLAEVGLVGKEGLAGIQAALGVEKKAAFQNIVQGGGTAMRLSIAHFQRELKRNGALQREANKFASLLMIQFAQTAGCNRYHHVSERLARWLLMCRDRMGANEFRLTQQFLAFMLGVQRPRISGAAAGLKKKRLIRYSRGVITILDDKGLLAASCACYEQVKSAYREA
jgi:CRP-like cAMP-binding protein